MFDRSLMLSLAFGGGVLLQALILLRNRFWTSSTLIPLFCGLFAFFPGKKERVYDFRIHLLLSFVMFGVGFAVTFRKEVLPVISEWTVISLSLVFLYAFGVTTPYLGYVAETTNTVGHDGLRALYWFCLMLPLAIPAVASAALVLWRGKMSGRLEIACYLLFIVMNLALLVHSFAFGNLEIFIDRSAMAASNLRWTDAILTGMALLYLTTYAAFLLMALPMTGKNQSWADRKKEILEYFGDLEERYEEQDVRFREAILMLLLAVVLLGGNYHFKFLSDFLVINALIVLSGFFASYQAKRRQPTTEA